MSGVDSEVRTEGGLGGGRRWRNLMIDARQSSSTVVDSSLCGDVGLILSRASYREEVRARSCEGRELSGRGSAFRSRFHYETPAREREGGMTGVRKRAPICILQLYVNKTPNLGSNQELIKNPSYRSGQSEFVFQQSLCNPQ